jgi:hypothetical protein
MPDSANNTWPPDPGSLILVGWRFVSRSVTQPYLTAKPEIALFVGDISGQSEPISGAIVLMCGR